MNSVTTRRTLVIFVVGVLAVIAMAAAIALELGGEQGVLVVSDFGETLVVGFSAAVILWVALSFGRSEPVRIQWLAIGAGVLMFALGDAVWSYFEVIRGVEPNYPGLPDVFYLMVYPLVGYGLVRAGLAYRGLVDLRRAAVISVILAAVLAAAMWFLVIDPHVLGSDLPNAETAISIAYPVGDLVLTLGPAVFVLLVVFGLGRGRFAWPWWAVTAGLALVAMSNLAFSYLQSYDLYESPSFIDYGWSLGFLLVALGASIFYDLGHPE